MGKRGPKVGTKYQKRVRITRILPVTSDRQLVAAQHYTDRLQRFISELEQRDRFPLSDLDAVVIERCIEATGLLQGAVIDGISRYLQDAE